MAIFRFAVVSKKLKVVFSFVERGSALPKSFSSYFARSLLFLWLRRQKQQNGVNKDYFVKKSKLKISFSEP